MSAENDAILLGICLEIIVLGSCIIHNIVLLFFRLKEAIILLNLMPGSAVLLKETVEENKRKLNKETSRAALDELGVYTLSFHEVLNVLNSRINWTK